MASVLPNLYPPRLTDIMFRRLDQTNARRKHKIRTRNGLLTDPNVKIIHQRSIQCALYSCPPHRHKCIPPTHSCVSLLSITPPTLPVKFVSRIYTSVPESNNVVDFSLLILPVAFACFNHFWDYGISNTRAISLVRGRAPFSQAIGLNHSLFSQLLLTRPMKNHYVY